MSSVIVGYPMGFCVILVRCSRSYYLLYSRRRGRGRVDVGPKGPVQPVSVFFGGGISLCFGIGVAPPDRRLLGVIFSPFRFCNSAFICADQDVTFFTSGIDVMGRMSGCAGRFI